ncbi:MAG TPA: outer membrane beta-barrel protein [Terriglobia bacterium]|nr:outer membrane beta-barrel protein [Terriglobia bacterium]
MFIHVLVLLLFIAFSAFGQNRPSVEFGIRGGVPLQPVVDLQEDQYFTFAGGRDYIYAPHYMVGSTVMLNFNPQVAIQFDALYKPIRFRSDQINSVTSFQTSTRGSWWEFPIMAKFRFTRNSSRPFANGGISFYHASGSSHTFYQNFLNGTQSQFSDPLTLIGSRVGIVMGGGVEFVVRRIRIAPEARYNQWPFGRSFATGSYPQRNQIDLLIGVSFHQ